MTRAEELRTLVAAYTRHLQYLEQMANAGPITGIYPYPPSPLGPIWNPSTNGGPAPTAAADSGTITVPPHPLKDAEDRVSLFINGGSCMTTKHEEASELDKLVMLKMLRMEFPHLSMSIASIESAIRRLAK